MDVSSYDENRLVLLYYWYIDYTILVPIHV